MFRPPSGASAARTTITQRGSPGGCPDGGPAEGVARQAPTAGTEVEAPFEVIRGTMFVCYFWARRPSSGSPSSSEWRCS